MATQNHLAEIRDLVTQWEQLVGHVAEVPDWAIEEMADHPDFYQTLFDVGQYMAYHIGSEGGAFVPEVYRNMPWAQWGMTATEYDTHISAFQAAFRQLTGQEAIPEDLLNRALAQNQGRMTGPQFETWLLTSDAIRQQYGWLKYGLDFQQFQTQKQQMASHFGRELSNEEGVAQLQYYHAAQGSNVSATAQPTISQQEKRQAEVGVSGSVVR